MLLLSMLCITSFARHTSSGSMPERPRVDRNVELLSIVWRLAGADEYCHTNFKRYTDAIEHHFGRYREHPLVEFARRTMYDNGTGYNAVPSMALHLDDALDLRRDVAKGSLEQRWEDVDRERFVYLLKKFAADTRFDRFYESNAEMYVEAARRFEPLFEAMDTGWYTDFLGTELKEKFVIVNGLGNGPCNYACSVEYGDGRREVYAVMGAWSVDGTGMVTFSTDDYLPTLLHEFNHSFVNPLTDRYEKALRKSGEALFAIVGEQMIPQAYPTWKHMMNEAMCSAMPIMYMKNRGAEQEWIDQRIEAVGERGWFWIGDLVAELERYAAARDRYPTFDDYMPRIVEAYGEWAEMAAGSIPAATAPASRAATAIGAAVTAN